MYLNLESITFSFASLSYASSIYYLSTYKPAIYSSIIYFSPYPSVYYKAGGAIILLNSSCLY